MRSLILSIAALFVFHQPVRACADYDPDYEYFNLFAQEMIHNLEYQPFLLTYSNPFYEVNKGILPEENIESWQRYFNDRLSYDEILYLVKKADLKHLKHWSKGKKSFAIAKKLGVSFFHWYKEGLEYLIKAKELEPYMSIRFVPDENSFYYFDEELRNRKNASLLDYSETMKSLLDLYKNTKDKEIKLRYAYQIVRFNHYTRNYSKAINYFKTLVEPLKLKSPIYYYALEQMAGAQRGLGYNDEANWNFFQVFIHSRNLKKSSYTSMKFSNEGDFKTLLDRAKTPEEKNTAYFLLAYNDFNNPIPILEKMLENNADSEIMKVLAARAINQLERNYLMVSPYCFDKTCEHKSRRLPVFHQSSFYDYGNYIQDFQQFIHKVQNYSDDEFWKLSDAYLQFLNQDFKKSNEILNNIKTLDSDYIQQIEKMKMLNDILSQEKITSDFEEVLMKKYKNIFYEQKEIEDFSSPDTYGFIIDILANRYFLEGQLAKSFLLHNKVLYLKYSPNLELTQSIQAFFQKPNKTAFENYIMENSSENIDAEAFFNLIYGDNAMRMANFKLAKSYYEKAEGFPYISRKIKGRKRANIKGSYDGFHHISNLIFGHNVWESFESKPYISMKPEQLGNFPFIKSSMNKVELANSLIRLEEIGKGTGDEAAKANQLIGNVLYNTSILGYYREVFTLDINNMNSPKFHFEQLQPQYQFYYKGYLGFIDPDNFDLAIHYYQKALNSAKDPEQKARILFQMASAEQGKYYQWEALQNSHIDYFDEDYFTKREQLQKHLDETKNNKFRSYFAELKKNYSQTQTVKALQGSCLYFGYYMKK